MIGIEDFKKLEIRIGKVKSVEKVENADRLLKFVFDIGGGGENELPSMRRHVMILQA